MSINLMGFLGYAALVLGAVGMVLYGLLWIVNRVRRGPEIY